MVKGGRAGDESQILLLETRFLTTERFTFFCWNLIQIVIFKGGVLQGEWAQVCCFLLHFAFLR